MSTATGPWQTGNLDVWPDAEELVVSWLKANMPGVNVRTETNTTFGTTKPDATMTLPLVLVQAVTSVRSTGSNHRLGDDSELTRTLMVDLQSYGPNRSAAWDLFHRSNAWLLRAKAQHTAAGAFDDVWFDNCAGIVPDTNPSLRRVIATYGIATRAMGTAS